MSSDAVVKWTCRLFLLAVALSPGVGTAASTTVVANICRPAIASTTLTSTTTSPTLQAVANLAGTTEPNAAVELTNNASSVATVLADSSGNFALSTGLLVGDNHLLANATDSCDHHSSSTEIIITRSLTPPLAPTISSPLPGSTTTDDTILVSGQTESLATVTILRGDQVLATLTSDSLGNFAASVLLVIGSNSLQITASNAAGTSPRSSALVVSRLRALSPAPAPAQGPATDLQVPVIISPTSDISTTASSVILVVQSLPGGIIEVFRGSDLLYTISVGQSGITRLEAAQNLGPNSWTVVAHQAAAVSGPSAPISILRLPAPLTIPVITTPADSTTVTTPWVAVAGTAEPGSILNVYAGGRSIARILISTDGTFAARVPLDNPTTVIYAQSTRGSDVRRSQAILVSYTFGPPPGVGTNIATIIMTGAGVVLGVADIVIQSAGDVTQMLASSPSVSTLVFAAALVSLTLIRGLAGLELVLTILPLLRWWRRLINTAHTGQIITVSDSVTGRPLPLVKAVIPGPRPYAIISDFAGRLHIPPHLDARQLRLSRPGYAAMHTIFSDHLLLEPQLVAFSSIRVALDLVLGVTAWLVLILALATSLMLTNLHPSPLSLALATGFSLLTIANLGFLASRPHLRWGRLIDKQTNRAISGATISLRSEDGKPISSYQSSADGRYTLHATAGQYEMIVKVPGYVTYRELVTIRRRPTYLGFSLKLTRD